MKLRASPADGGLIIKDRYYHLRKYHSSFVGELIISKLNESETQCHTMYNLCVCWRPVLWGTCVVLLGKTCIYSHSASLGTCKLGTCILLGQTDKILCGVNVFVLERGRGVVNV